MKRYIVIVVLLLFCRALQAEDSTVVPQPDAEPSREPHWELFLDNYIIERSTGFRRVVHHPRPCGVVLKPDKPWETQGLSPLYVGHRKDGSLECYYRVLGGGLPSDSTGYAISRDGIHWEKPVLGMVEGPGGKENNLLPCGLAVDMGRNGNVSDPAMRFLISLGAEDGSGMKMRLFFGSKSPDFINDPDWRKKLVEMGTKPSYKLGLHFWDDVHKEWVFMRQSPNHPPTRAVARWVTEDLRNWTIRPVFYPDASDSSDPSSFDEVYGMRAVYTEGLVLGFIEWFKGDQTRPDFSVLPQELIGRVHMKGPMEVRIAVSRDWGYTWDRTVSREAWIPHGTEHDSYDRCVVQYTAPVRVGDEDWFYCTAINGNHGSSMGYYRDRTATQKGALYTQEHNRYVSLTTDNTPQILITKPLKVTGKTLQFNVDASRGEVTVGIALDRVIEIPGYPPGILPNFMVRDRQGNTHLEQGFRLEDCEPIRANSIQHDVKFNAASIESLKGKTVRLYIMVQDADLYGFRFK